MGNAASSGSAPRTAVAPRDQQHKAAGDHGSQTASPQQQPTEPLSQWALNDPVAAFTLWLAVATTGLLIFTGGLWLATYRLGRDAKASGADQAKKMERSIAEAAKAAIAMEKMAEAADAQIKLAQETAQAELQAYVAVQIDGLPNFGLGEIAEATIKIINTGVTPAYAMTQYGTIIFAPYPLMSDPMSNELIYSGVASRNTLHNREPYGAAIYGHEPITEKDIAAFQAGHTVVYVIGNVDYKDAFKRQRRTEFCYFLNINAVSAADAKRKVGAALGKHEKVEIRWALGNLHNDAT
jgi:hypothetical protein